uniref:NP-Aca-7 n=1 Tax=Acanthophis wellsi TaxID=239747 RepID=R4G7E4_9SAUR
MVGLSRLAGGGLLLLLVLALLPLALDGKPTAPPQALRTAPAGGMMASRRELTEQPQQPLIKDSSGPAAERSGSKTATKGNGCFGVRLDRIGSVSGMGCGGVPKPTPGGS